MGNRNYPKPIFYISMIFWGNWAVRDVNSSPCRLLQGGGKMEVRRDLVELSSLNNDKQLIVHGKWAFCGGLLFLQFTVSMLQKASCFKIWLGAKIAVKVIWCLGVSSWVTLSPKTVWVEWTQRGSRCLCSSFPSCVANLWTRTRYFPKM